MAEMLEEAGLKSQVEVGPCVGETRYQVISRALKKQVPKVTRFFAARCLGSASWATGAPMFKGGQWAGQLVWVGLDQLRQMAFKIPEQRGIVEEALVGANRPLPRCE